MYMHAGMVNIYFIHLRLKRQRRAVKKPVAPPPTNPIAAVSTLRDSHPYH